MLYNIYMHKLDYSGPLVLAVLDGVGLGSAGPGNAISLASTPFLESASQNHLHLALSASGEAVGLLPGQMGNSEVGHNTMGSGQIFPQGIAHINSAFSDGSIWQSPAWQNLIRALKNPDSVNIVNPGVDNSKNPSHNEKFTPKTLHFAGIFSDGGVHSHLDHLEKMLQKAYSAGLRRFRIHVVLDGRDVAPQSEPKFINRLNDFAKTLPDADLKIASGCGRMTAVADRYENNWDMVEKGFNQIVHGIADHYFPTANEAIEALRLVHPDLQDQYFPTFVIVDQSRNPIGAVKPGDAIVYFDFRADRAVEIAKAFSLSDFPHFNRGDFRPQGIFFAGLTEYDSDRHLPKHQLVPPLEFTTTLHDFLGARQISQFAVSETAKFGHITYYFNGNSYQPAPLEDFAEIPSGPEPFEKHPAMKTTAIIDTVIKNLNNYRFIRLNFPGGDMVGHSADIDATVKAIEAIDQALARLAQAVDSAGGCLIITADHGNAEELLDSAGQPKTAHTANQVPCIFYDNTKNRHLYALRPLEQPGLANLAATIALLLGQPDYPTPWQKPLIMLK